MFMIPKAMDVRKRVVVDIELMKFSKTRDVERR